jgi:inner membrane protein
VKSLEEGFGSREAAVHVRLARPEQNDRTAAHLTSGSRHRIAGPCHWHATTSSARLRLAASRFGGVSAPPAAGERRSTYSGSLVPASNAQAQFLAGRTVPSLAEETALPRNGADHALALASDGIDAVAIALVDPVNIYSQADRASKYGLLFVVLTFVGFFMFELIRELRIHPIQYSLVGLSLAIFFLLLVSLSEHIAFLWAYLVASAACIGLLAFYLTAVLRSTGRGLGFAAMLATLYAALYGLLVSEDNALVLGAASIRHPRRDHGGRTERSTGISSAPGGGPRQLRHDRDARRPAKQKRGLRLGYRPRPYRAAGRWPTTGSRSRTGDVR